MSTNMYVTSINNIMYNGLLNHQLA